MANNRIKRDLDDRLADRVQEVLERSTTADPDDIARRERLDAFRDKWANSALPEIPAGTILECTCVGYQQPILTTVSTNVWRWVMSQLKLVN